MAESNPTVTDPFDRDGITIWCRDNGFVDYRGDGCFDRCYSLAYGYVTLSVYMPDSQICALLVVRIGNLGERKSIQLGPAYTVEPIDALWAALQALDYDRTHQLSDQAHAYFRAAEVLQSRAKTE